MTHQVLGDENIYNIVGDHAGLPWPFDLAVLPVSKRAWTATRHESRAIGVELIAIAHQPVQGELLTFTGFSGEATDFHFNHLHTEGTCYTAREVALPADQRWNPRFHFGIDYRPDLAIKVSGNRGLPSPPGLSGSTVWDTGFVAAKMAENEWSPEMARVTGVVWGWPSSHGFLVATRAEYIRSFLLDVPRVLGDTTGRRGRT